ncbi:uncharacterized protein LOC114175418 [Vigna unguiculata]|uniref:uncharacterized protein LOC114175418 n=1 Tax=Vigna unguiculata TaxID=3917 RepID=UPI00101615A3|nr:uncharacterized protein LOC114175418 [Vigna unguiculata]
MASENTAPTDESQNPSSSFYLHPGENSGATLVNIQLDEANYHAWSRAMKRALISKNKHKFLDGSVKTPTHGTILHDVWERYLWDDLRERFSKGDHFRISDLLQELHSTKQGERSVTDFFTNLKALWEELESLRPTPSCTCKVKCECDFIKTVIKHKEFKYIMCFLKGLNDVYGTVKTQILLIEPLPGINRVFSLVMQQERQLIGNTIESSKILVAAANTEDQRNSKNHVNWKGQGQGRGKNRSQNNGKQCSYCHKLYHTIDECYAKHGYPPWYKTKGEKVVNNTIVEKDETVIKQHDQRPSKESSIFSDEQMLQI